MSVTLRGGLVGKSASIKTGQWTRGIFGGTDGVEGASKKESLVADGDRTKTDTGG